jgi:hypothetical protein
MKVIDFSWRFDRDVSRIEVPSIEERQAVPYVSERDGEVDGALAHLGDRMPTVDCDPVVIRESNLLDRIMDPARHEKTCEQRTFGDPG